MANHGGLIDFSFIANYPPDPAAGFFGIIDFTGIPHSNPQLPPSPASRGVTVSTLPVFIPQERSRVNAAEEVELVELIMAGVL